MKTRILPLVLAFAATSLDTTAAQWMGEADEGNAVPLATDGPFDENDNLVEIGELVEFEIGMPDAYPVRFFKIRTSFKTAGGEEP